MSVSSGAANVNSYQATATPCTGPQVLGQNVQAAGGNCSYVIVTVADQDLNNSTFQWYQGLKGDTSHPISGANSYWTTVCPAVTTSYWVRVTFADGSCSTDSNTLQVNR